MKIVKDETVTTTYGFFECLKCESRFYGNGSAIHDKPECKDDGYQHCVYRVGPKCEGYEKASGIEIYSIARITEMSDTWRNYNGFTGETCGVCKKTANVLALGPGWVCDCKHFNVQSFIYVQIPHDNPDMGTPKSIIVAGHQNSKRHVEFLRSIETDKDKPA